MDGYGGRIKAAREALGMTQAMLGQRLGYNQTAVSRWELERLEPSRADYIALGKALNQDPAYLMGLPSGQPVLSQDQLGFVNLGVELARLEPSVRVITIAVGRALNQYAGRGRLVDVLRSMVPDIPSVDDRLRRKGRRGRKAKAKSP